MLLKYSIAYETHSIHTFCTHHHYAYHPLLSQRQNTPSKALYPYLYVLNSI